MEPISEKEKFAKAKIEEPDVRLPKAMLKPDADPLDDLCYMKIFGAKLDRKVYRIRNKELVKVLGDDFEGMKEIQRVSKATIGILANAESNLHSHSYLDLVGSHEEVTTAEQLILAKVLKTYSSLTFPIILMPPTIYGDHIILPLHKVVLFLGNSGRNLLWIEMESGAWIKIEPGPSPGGWEVKVYGPREHVNKAISLIHSVISEPGGLSVAEALNELLHQLKGPSCVELIDGEKYDNHRESRSKGELETQKKKHNYKEAYWSQVSAIKSSVSVELSCKRMESTLEDKKKQKQRESRWRRVYERKKSVNGKSRSKQREGESKKEKAQREFLEGKRGRTFLRIKKSKKGEGESEKGKKQHEFKEPTWSQTFGYMKPEGSKQIEEAKHKHEQSGELENGKQKLTRAEEDEKEVNEYKEKREEYVDQEVDSGKPENDIEGDESKEKIQVDVGKASEHKESEMNVGNRMLKNQQGDGWDRSTLCVHACVSSMEMTLLDCAKKHKENFFND